MRIWQSGIGSRWKHFSVSLSGALMLSKPDSFTLLKEKQVSGEQIMHGKVNCRNQKYCMSGQCFLVLWLTGDISGASTEQ